MPTLTYPNLGKLPIKPTLQDLFRYGEGGAAYAFPDLSSLFQDAAGTVPVTAIGQQVYRVNDISGRNNHLLQATANFRPRLGRAPAGGVRNLLTYTEDISNAVWMLDGDFGGGTVAKTAGGVAFLTPSTDRRHAIWNNSFVPAASGDQFVISALVVPAAGSEVIAVGSRAGTAKFGWAAYNTATRQQVAGYSVGAPYTSLAFLEAIEVSPGVWLMSVLVTANGEVIGPIVHFGATGQSGNALRVSSGTGELGVVRMQVQRGSVDTPYQKVTDPWDVTEAGKRDCYCLYGDGVDDTMATAASVFPVRNGMSLVSAFAIAGIGPTPASTPIFGAFLSTTLFTISARRSAATQRQLVGFVRNIAPSYSYLTNLGNAGFYFNQPVVAAVTQADDVMSVWSENPTSDRVGSVPLGSTVSAAVPIGVLQVANNGPVRWHGGIIIDRPLTDLERAFAMEQYAYLSGAIE